MTAWLEGQIILLYYLKEFQVLYVWKATAGSKLKCFDNQSLRKLVADILHNKDSENDINY